MTKPTDQTSRRGLSRRQILKATGGAAALLAAAKLNFPAGAFAQSAGPEVTKAKLGFIALTDAAGRRMRVNATACALTGRSREELLGGNVFDVRHPEDRDEDIRQYQRLVAGEIDRYSVEKRIVRKGGGVIWASVMCSGVRDSDGKFLYAVRIFQDITEAKRAADALAESEQRLAATYEHASIAISEVDAQGRVSVAATMRAMARVVSVPHSMFPSPMPGSMLRQQLAEIGCV